MKGCNEQWGGYRGGGIVGDSDTPGTCPLDTCPGDVSLLKRNYVEQQTGNTRTYK